MKSTLGRAIATGTLLALPVSVITTMSPAEASAGCVTRKEFRKVHQGMRMGRVHNIFDTSGSRFYYDDSPPPFQSRVYDRCPGGQAAVYFEKRRGKWRLQGKSWSAT